MLEKLKKSGVSAIVPTQKAVGRAIQIARKSGVTIGLATAGGAALWLGFQQLILQQQAANFQNRIDTIQKNMEQIAPKNLPDKDRLTLQKDLATLEKERITAENAIRSSLIQGLGGLFIIATAYIGWRNLLVAQEKQTAERFSKAVEQLSSDNIHVRLGGIYALEQIAKDAEEKYYWPVMETLAAYVKERAKRQTETDENVGTGHFGNVFRSYASDFSPYGSTSIPRAFTPTTTTQRTDIQAILDILSRREHIYKTNDRHLDLSETDLRELVFSGNFTGIRFNRSNLQKIYTKEANFQNSEFRRTRLLEASLFRAVFQEVHLAGTDLRGAVLIRADFRNAHLSRAYLSHSNVDGASFQGASIASDLQQVEGLSWKQLEEAKQYDKKKLPDYLLQNPPTASVD